ncbi:MAG: hypothetical protein WB763_11265, partial [Terriglobia bacterium]
AEAPPFQTRGEKCGLGSQTELLGDALDLGNELGASPPLCDDDEAGEDQLLPSVVRGQLSVVSYQYSVKTPP